MKRNTPTVRQSVLRLLSTFKRLGTEEQKREALNLENQLSEEEPLEAVNFATAEEHQSEGKK